MKQLEYIQSTGTQYINTGINLSAGAEITTEFEFTSVGTNYYNPVYGTQNSASPWNSFYCRYDKQYARLVYTGGYTNNNSININTKYSTTQKISSSANEFWLDNNKILDSTSSNTITTEPLYIFGMRNGGDTHTSFVKLYSLTIKNCTNGVVLYNFVPAKDNNDVVCLYDKVSKTYYYNSGTGTFTAGPEVKELVANINDILEEKEMKIIPENIKHGAQIFDVVGNYTGTVSGEGAKLFTDINTMQADPSPNLDDLAVVYDENINGYTILHNNVNHNDYRVPGFPTTEFNINNMVIYLVNGTYYCFTYTGTVPGSVGTYYQLRKQII